jgi:hypothetical protein
MRFKNLFFSAALLPSLLLTAPDFAAGGAEQLQKLMRSLILKIRPRRPPPAEK